MKQKTLLFHMLTNHVTMLVFNVYFLNYMHSGVDRCENCFVTKQLSETFTYMLTLTVNALWALVPKKY